LYRLWYSDLKGPEVCDALGVSDSSLQRLRARYKLPPRDHIGGPKGNRKIIDPSPEEIEERVIGDGELSHAALLSTLKVSSDRDGCNSLAG
jgi:hypothetical protein